MPAATFCAASTLSVVLAGEYELVLTPPARRALTERSPEAVAAAVINVLTTALVREPPRVGKPLRGDLAAIWSARRGSYRVLYRVREDTQEVVVLRIGTGGTPTGRDRRAWSPTYRSVVRAFEVGNPAEAPVEREQLRAVDERCGEGDRVGEPQCAVRASQLCRASCYVAIDWHDRCADGGDERIDAVLAAVLERAHEDLGIHAGGDQESCSGREARPEEFDGLPVLRVRRVEKRDQDVCVERYGVHSSRSSSRCPGG